MPHAWLNGDALMQRYEYWYTDNYQTPQCPSGMRKQSGGEYVLYAATQKLRDKSAQLATLKAIATSKGYASIAEALAAAPTVEFLPVEHTGD